MHYYQFNLGDYTVATAHLSVEEDCAYRRLMDLYYSSEAPLADDCEAIGRRIRMGDHLQAIYTVLEEFFELIDGKWHNSRCDAEIERYHERAEQARVNGRRGGRPPNNPAGTQPVSEKNPAATGLKANQEPRTNNHKPITKEKPRKRVTASRPPDVSESVWCDFTAQRKTKVTETALAGIRREAQAALIPLEDALAMACERGWQSFKADWAEGKGSTKTVETTAKLTRIEAESKEREEENAFLHEMTRRRQKHQPEGKVDIDDPRFIEAEIKALEEMCGLPRFAEQAAADLEQRRIVT